MKLVFFFFFPLSFPLSSFSLERRAKETDLSRWVKGEREKAKCIPLGRWTIVTEVFTSITNSHKASIFLFSTFWEN